MVQRDARCSSFTLHTNSQRLHDVDRSEASRSRRDSAGGRRRRPPVCFVEIGKQSSSNSAPRGASTCHVQCTFRLWRLPSVSHISVTAELRTPRLSHALLLERPKQRSVILRLTTRQTRVVCLMHRNIVHCCDVRRTCDFPRHCVRTRGTTDVTIATTWC